MRGRGSVADVGAFEAGGGGGSNDTAKSATVAGSAKAQCSMRNCDIENARERFAHAGHKAGEVFFLVQIDLGGA